MVSAQTRNDLLDTFSGKAKKLFFDVLMNIKENKARTISFNGCKLEDGMIERFLNAIPHKSSIKELSFDNCDLSEAKCVDLLHGMANKSSSLSLEKLSIKGNAFGGDAIVELMGLIDSNPKLKELDLSDNKIITSGAVKILGAVVGSEIEKINFRNNLISDGAVTDYIPVVADKNTPLREVDFYSYDPVIQKDLVSKKYHDELNKAMLVKRLHLKKKQYIEKTNRANVVYVVKRGR